ncbi:MAG: hypothetical protein WA011_08310 [Lactococcus raffinolactis]
MTSPFGNVLLALVVADFSDASTAEVLVGGNLFTSEASFDGVSVSLVSLSAGVSFVGFAPLSSGG